jgi:CDP-glucose 4,6-dehydratase
MYENPDKYSDQWNIGPVKESIQSVLEVANKMQEFYESSAGYVVGMPFNVIESKTLGLDITKALNRLDWAPEQPLNKVLHDLVDYFKRQQAKEPEPDICLHQVKEFFTIGE